MSPFVRGMPPSVRASGFLALALIAALAFALHRWATYPRPEPWGSATETAGLRLGLRLLDDPAAARRSFGIDLTAAGLLALRLEATSTDGAGFRLRPERIFLADAGGRARPLLTAAEARRRLITAGTALPAGTPTLADATQAAPNLTGFALALVTRPAETPALNQRSGASLWLAAILGLDPHPLETRVLAALVAGLQLNPGVAGGRAAEGYLIFPAGESLGRGTEVWLGVERSAGINVLRLPLSAQPATP